MSYVDGFIIPVPKKNLKTYARMAKLGANMWMKHGAIDYKECIGDDLQSKWGMPFPKLLKLKRCCPLSAQVPRPGRHRSPRASSVRCRPSSTLW